MNDIVLWKIKDLTATQKSIEAAASDKANLCTSAARASAKKMDVMPVLANIDAQILNVVGASLSAL